MKCHQCYKQKIEVYLHKKNKNLANEGIISILATTGCELYRLY